MSAAGSGEGRSTWARRGPRWGLIAAAVLAVLLLVAGIAASWHFSGEVVVPDHSGWPEDVTVEEVRAGRIVLERTEETVRPGYYGLDWQAGHAIAGPLLAGDDETVTRYLLDVDGYLISGLKVGIDSNIYAGNPRESRGLPFRPVRIAGELGPMPAWLVPSRRPIPGRERTWAIFVHGINSSPQTGLRVAPLLRRAGLPTLYITYREDLGAPESPDGYHHMGLTEWRDLEAASRYALSHGAEELVLIGYSMGGAIVTQFMQKSELADRVEGLVLDAPVLDWKETIEFNATEMGFPGIAALPVEWAVGIRIDADWDSLDAIHHTADLQLPILLFHGTEDDIVPIETSDAFTEELPRWVRYYRVPKAGHTQAWNVNPRLYARRIGSFLSGAVPVGENAEDETSPTKGSGSK